jgi:hypothetical protein
VRAQKSGMRMGLYHSIFEFFHPLYLQDKANNLTTSRYVDEVYRGFGRIVPLHHPSSTLYQIH